MARKGAGQTPQYKRIVEYIAREITPELFSGASFDGVVMSGSMSNPVSWYRNKNGMKVRIDDGTFWTVTRAQRFSDAEKSLLGSILTLSRKYQELDYDTQRGLLSTSLGNAIARTIASLFGPKLEQKVWPIATEMLEQVEAWSSQTYEGSRITVSIGLCPSERKNGISFHDYCDEDFSRVLSNGLDTIVVFGVYGKLSDHLGIREESELPRAPLRYSRIAAEAGGHGSKSNSKAVFVLTRTGEILVFGNGQLLFSKRRGTWKVFNHDALLTKMAFGSRKLGELLRQAVYETCLDVSFAKTGACVGIIQKTRRTRFDRDNRIHDQDSLVEGSSVKSRTLQELVGKKKFQEIPRTIRLELAGIDGAIVLDSDGRILAVGAILRIDGGSRSGARRAAAECLASYGVGIKVSNDGEITVIRSDESYTIG
jgi:hypothetical protein